MVMKLGLDASTTVCGWAFSHDNVIKDAGFIDISKFNTNKEKSFHIISILSSNILMKEVSEINLESALSGFMGGRTKQQVIIKLARFNAVLEFILDQQFKIPINLLNVGTIRKKVFGKARQKGMDGKFFVKKQLSLLMPLPTRWDRINKRGGWDKKNEDMYDAIVTSLY
jgi:hypothetical protein